MAERPNIYKLIPKKYLTEKYYNPNPLTPKHPARICFVGASGTGKTSTLIWMINEAKNFQKIYLYAKKLTEPLYEWLIDTWEQKSKEIGKDLIEYSNSVDDIINVDSIDESLQNLIIIDDMISEKNLSKVSELFIRSRKQNCTIAFLSQRYHAIPSDVRINSNYFIFMPGIRGRDMINMATDQAGAFDRETFMTMYRKATANNGFLLIDNETTDKKLMFRRNFDQSLL